MSTFGDFTSLDLVECVDALASRVQGVHQMHRRRVRFIAATWESFEKVRFKRREKFPRLAFDFDKISRASQTL